MDKCNINKSSLNKKGFTLIELIVVIGIATVIGIFGFTNLYNSRSESDLDLTAREIIFVLRNAQDRSINQEEGYEWGVNLTSALDNSYYDLFKNITSNVVVKTNLRSNITFFDPFWYSAKEVFFNYLTGQPNISTTIKFALKNDLNKARVIYINSNGQMSIDKISLANTITTVDSIGNVGSYSSIVIGSDGLPIVSYYIGGGTSDLKILKCGNLGCYIP